MYRFIQSGNKGFFVAIAVLLAAFFIIICDNSVYGADQSKNSDKKFRSEEDLIDETRREVETHLNDTGPVRINAKEAAEETPQNPQEAAAVKETPQAAQEAAAVKETPQVEMPAQIKQDLTKEEKQAIAEKKQAPVEEKQSPIEKETKEMPKEETPDQIKEEPVKEEKQPAAESKVEYKPGPEIQGSPAYSPGPETVSPVNDPRPAEEKTILPSDTEKKPAVSGGEPGDAANSGSSQFVEEKGILPSDVTPVAMDNVNKPIAKEVDFGLGKKAVIKPAAEEPILKKMDISKIGASPYYDTYEGLRLLKYFTVAQRVEIYQEPRPIDSYMLDAYAMRYLYEKTPWNIKSDYRTQLVPIFTRAYGTEFTMSDPKNKEGQIRYTHDYRNIYKNYFPKYQYTIPGHVTQANIKEEMWDQNEVLLMHSKIIEPINWAYTSNLGYRFSTMNTKSDPSQSSASYSYYEIRSTYLGSLSLAPTDKIEYFMQGEYYKSSHVKCSWASNPDHFLGRGEIRIKSKDYKTVFVPQFSYSKDLYYPIADTFEKYEIAFRVGRDFTKRSSASSTIQYVYSYRDEPDNQAPLYNGIKNPHKDKAEYISLQNRFSYNVYDRLYLQAGFDIANGINWSIFDNLGLLGGIEYYAPGMIRVNVGYRGNYYYNVEDWMSSIYFKFYLFM